MRDQVTSAGMVENSGPSGSPTTPRKAGIRLRGDLGKVIPRLLQIVNEGIGHQVRRARGAVMLDALRQAPLAAVAEVGEIGVQQAFHMHAQDRDGVEPFEGPGLPERRLHGRQAFHQRQGVFLEEGIAGACSCAGHQRPDAGRHFGGGGRGVQDVDAGRLLRETPG